MSIQRPGSRIGLRAALGGRFHAARVALLSAGCIVLIVLGWHLIRATPAEAAPVRTSETVTVDSALVHRADVPVYLDGLGTAQAFYTAKITSRVDGQLQDIAFIEGKTVRKGDLLARIDPRPYKAAFDQASANRQKDIAQLANARRDLDRYTSLEPSHLASRQQLDTQKALVTQLQAQIQADQAAVDNARTQLGYTSIVSPIDGRTGIRLVDPGNIVRATDATGIVVVTQVQPISVVFTLPEESLTSISKALETGPVEVMALSRDGNSELDRGALALIDNEIDQATGTARLKATFPNAHNTLWPGEFVNARVLVRTEHEALTIPSAALQRGVNGPFAYVVKSDSTVEARVVQTDGESGDVAVIQAGLKDGERVVTSNQFRLQGGAKVRINPGAGAVAQASEFARVTS